MPKVAARPEKKANGKVQLDGRVKGYISGTVDGVISGTVDGEVNVTLMSKKLSEEEAKENEE